MVHIVQKSPALVYTRDFFAAFLLTILGVQIVFECHEVPQRQFKKFLLKRILKHRETRVVVYISHRMKDILYRGLLAGEIVRSEEVVAHDGVDLSAFVSTETQEQIRKRLKLPMAGYVIGYTGSLFPGRGIGIILGLASRFREDLFVVVGGHSEDIEKVKLETRQRGIGNLLFVGHLGNAQVPEYLLSFDALLMPYQRRVFLEGGRDETTDFMSPLKMFEYMASGRPIISSRLPVLEEVLIDGRNAILVEAGDLGQWSETVMLLKKNRKLAERIGKQARADVRSYSWDSRVRTILDGL
jgi:glycosyltransferase involved in cell wall biosynthesis